MPVVQQVMIHFLAVLATKLSSNYFHFYSKFIFSYSGPTPGVSTGLSVSRFGAELNLTDGGGSAGNELFYG